jgi:4-oxalomesaconate tautomerase
LNSAALCSIEEKFIMQTKIPCVLMRGGTSRGPFFLASDLPADPQQRDEVLLAVMGSPHDYQVDGIGGANPLTSKVAIISKSQHPDADVDYLFAQVLINEKLVDTKPNCGNMLVAVGPFAIEAGLVPAKHPETVVRIFNVNTQSQVESIVQTPNGVVTYAGDTAIDGVPGAAAPVKLNFKSAAGAVTGKLLPTGRPLDRIDGIDVSCVDMAMPMVLMPAEQLGKTGHESAAELDADKALFARMEAVRRKAGQMMGMGDVSKLVVPKIGLLTAPSQGGTITSRYFVPYSCHKAHAVTGTVCVASACAIPGTVAARVAPRLTAPQGVIKIEHPSGMIAIDLDVDLAGDKPVIRRAALIRTARRLFDGHVYVPEKIWSGAEKRAPQAKTRTAATAKVA